MKITKEKIIKMIMNGSTIVFAVLILLMLIITLCQARIVNIFSNQIKAEIDGEKYELEKYKYNQNNDNNTNIKVKSNKANKKNEKYSDVKILAVGDVMVHTPQLTAQMTEDGYKFTNNFEYIKDIVSDSDIAIANLETTLAGPDYKYDGYPRFNTPDTLLTALKETGFNVINFCNNHILDMGGEALKRTISVIEENQLPYIGVRKSIADKRFIVVEKNDIKVAITGYTYQIPTGTTPTLNGNPIPAEMTQLINTFNYYDLENDFVNIDEVIDEMKIEADVIVFVIHWGNEYETVANEYQKKIATHLASKGVNVIFGSHPHVLQPFDTIGSTNVFYSMGNFISNQRYEAMSRRDTEDGIILRVTYRKDYDRKLISYIGTDYIATWVNKYYSAEKNKNVYEILPLNTIVEEKSTRAIMDNLATVFKNNDRATMSYMSTNNIIANSNIKNLNEISIIYN